LYNELQRELAALPAWLPAALATGLIMVDEFLGGIF